MTLYDTLIIGGGPAGLSAALGLARFDRSVALFDAGQGRSTWHQVNYNYLGFPGGIPARELRERGRRQLDDYPQVTCLEHKIDAARREGETFVVSGQAGEWQGRSLILCAGVVDHYPHYADWDEYVGRSMFWCITCDGYGARGKRIVVTGDANEAACEALQLSRFTRNITVLTDSHECHISDDIKERLDRLGIPLICDRIETVEGRDGLLSSLCTQSGQRIPLDQLFSVQGATPQTHIATTLGVTLDAQGYVICDAEQKTNVPGFFAAGDVTSRYDQQITAAVHEGAQAASAANYYLYPPDLKDE